jgi:hypothetical protein
VKLRVDISAFISIFHKLLYNKKSILCQTKNNQTKVEYIMMEKQLFLLDLKKQVINSTDEKEKEVLNKIIQSVQEGKYAIRLWD